MTLGILGIFLCACQALASTSPFEGPKIVPVRVLTPFRRPAELSSSEEASEPELDSNNSDDEEEVVHTPFSRRPGAFGIAGRVAGGLDSWADFGSALPGTPPKIAKNYAVYKAQVEERFRSIQATPLEYSQPQMIHQTPSPDDRVSMKAPVFLGPSRDLSDSPEFFEVPPVLISEIMTNPFMGAPNEESHHDSISSVSDEEEEERVFNPKASKRSRLIDFVPAPSNTFLSLVLGVQSSAAAPTQSYSDVSGGHLRNHKKRAAKEAFDH